jgi:hypothetical protein
VLSLSLFHRALSLSLASLLFTWYSWIFSLSRCTRCLNMTACNPWEGSQIPGILPSTPPAESVAMCELLVKLIEAYFVDPQFDLREFVGTRRTNSVRNFRVCFFVSFRFFSFLRFFFFLRLLCYYVSACISCALFFSSFTHTHTHTHTPCLFVFTHSLSCIIISLDKEREYLLRIPIKGAPNNDYGDSVDEFGETSTQMDRFIKADMRVFVRTSFSDTELPNGRTVGRIACCSLLCTVVYLSGGLCFLVTMCVCPAVSCCSPVSLFFFSSSFFFFFFFFLLLLFLFFLVLCFFFLDPPVYWFLRVDRSDHARNSESLFHGVGVVSTRVLEAASEHGLQRPTRISHRHRRRAACSQAHWFRIMRTAQQSVHCCCILSLAWIVFFSCCFSCFYSVSQTDTAASGHRKAAQPCTRKGTSRSHSHTLSVAYLVFLFATTLLFLLIMLTTQIVE